VARQQVHAPGGAEEALLPLEQFYKDSVDTGIRAQELCDIQIGDLNLGTNSVKIGGKGHGRDKKERHVFISKRTAKALWRYITPRLSASGEEDRLFAVNIDDDPRPMSRDVLRRLLKRIGDRAGVSGVHPHRFRHTFAINYLRNGGDVFTLQALLGHSSLVMVQRYLRIAQTDCSEAHKQASPVENWRL
jgi:integrase/recombinase XerD